MSSSRISTKFLLVFSVSREVSFSDWDSGIEWGLSEGGSV
jgi:hypothetical protein